MTDDCLIRKKKFIYKQNFKLTFRILFCVHFFSSKHTKSHECDQLSPSYFDCIYYIQEFILKKLSNHYTQNDMELTCIFGSKPNFYNAFFKGLYSSSYNFLCNKKYIFCVKSFIFYIQLIFPF